MTLAPLTFAALIGCPTLEPRTQRAEGTAPLWAPVADARSEVDTGAPDEGPPQTVCFDVPEVDALEAEPTFHGAAWLPAGPDFDFDADGFVVTSVGEDLVRFDHDGVGEIVVQGAGPIAAVRSLPSGELVFTRPQHGMAALFDPATDRPRPFLGGLRQAAALEVGLDGAVYVADEVHDGRVWMADPYTGAVEAVLEAPFPSALALSPDDETLYVAVSSRRYGVAGRIVAIGRDADGGWDRATARVVLRTESRVDAMTTDVCGNLYVGEHDTARVLRIRVGADEAVEQVAAFEPAAPTGPGPFDTQSFDDQGLTALRFGAGAGGFPEDTLFTSTGGMLYALPVGVAGRHVLSGP